MGASAKAMFEGVILRGTLAAMEERALGVVAEVQPGEGPGYVTLEGGDFGRRAAPFVRHGE